MLGLCSGNKVDIAKIEVSHSAVVLKMKLWRMATSLRKARKSGGRQTQQLLEQW